MEIRIYTKELRVSKNGNYMGICELFPLIFKYL